MAAMGCVSSTTLSESERQKLDPQLTMLVRGDAASDAGYDVGLRADGSKEYGVIIRSTNAAEIRNAGIQVGSAFSDVVTARVTIAELRKILTLPSVRSVQASSKNQPQ